ncbi:MAG: thioredoxin-disulfide reductase [Ignavibacteria bacterium]|nr:thioredoxin-disulfide reductase [Ignavibacteria bacterium]MCU7499832.1 thioredoxin-disulfide reductase [Ignavibacteria bacterium]MCU7513275.1 thioredoxin-disulfide reductase [Ignavibacteria bacterium]MCU7522162.1 thioredoxin-disulfide reductase [Ignavibacteria bacterium]MCU7525832.1 thioredoxin-disulfide reductase [Ignavibacteria bacterium]
MKTESNHYRVLIIGSGPAGLTAALYNARANLNPVVFEGMQPGGQLTITTDIENYPGFEEGIQGPRLMEIMRKQAQKFGAKLFFKEVTAVDFSKRPFTIKSYDETYTADSVIISTGASARLLELESAKKYMGCGVSACATCDGFFFKNLKVLVVGGGDTAMEEATYLTKHASEVIVIHRRDEFRASKIMFERAKQNSKIKFLTNRVIKEVLGVEENGRKFITGAILQNTVDGSTEEIKADGIFIAIGHKPNTEVFADYLEMDETGYLVVKPGTTHTNIEGVFAAGDVADKHYRQAITAAGTGCMAAIDAERWLMEQGMD